jgi:hypothetical protein
VSVQPVRGLISVISVMCGIIIALTIGIALWDLYTRREVKKKARHITVALATFSEDGRILVKSDGTIPVQAIETKADLAVCAEDQPTQRA